MQRKEKLVMHDDGERDKPPGKNIWALVELVKESNNFKKELDEQYDKTWGKVEVDENLGGDAKRRQRMTTVDVEDGMLNMAVVPPKRFENGIGGKYERLESRLEHMKLYEEAYRKEWDKIEKMGDILKKGPSYDDYMRLLRETQEEREAADYVQALEEKTQKDILSDLPERWREKPYSYHLIQGKGFSLYLYVIVILSVLMHPAMATNGFQVVGGQCCDVNSAGIGSNLNCTPTTTAYPTNLIKINNVWTFPQHTFNTFVYNSMGTIFTDCSKTDPSYLGDCQLDCSIANASLANHTCSGDPNYCATVTCKSLYTCFCKTAFGSYNLIGFNDGTMGEFPVQVRNCAMNYYEKVPLVTMVDPGLYLGQLLGNDSIYYDFSGSFLIMIFPSEGKRVVSSQCKNVYFVSSCYSEICMFDLNKVCIPGENAEFTIYLNQTTNHVTVPCPRNFEFICPESESFFDTTRYKYWSCISPLEKTLAILGILYFASVVFFVAAWVWTICTPLRLVVKKIACGVWKMTRFHKTKLFRRLSGKMKEKYVVVADYLDYEDSDLKSRKEDVETPKMIRKPKQTRTEVTVSTDSEDDPFIAEMIAKAEKRRNMAQGSRTAYILLIPLLFSFINPTQAFLPYSTDCTNSDIVASRDIIQCTITGSSKVCLTSMDVVAFLPSPNSVHCFDYVDANQTFQQTFVQYVYHMSYADLYALYYTSAWDEEDTSHKSCDGVYPCVSNNCGLMPPTDVNANGALSGDATTWPGDTRCDASCGCAGCRCLRCSSACLFSRAAVRPSGPAGLVSNFVSTREEPFVMATIVTNKGVVDQFVFTNTQPSENGNFTFAITGEFVNSVTTFNGQKVLFSDNKSWVTPACENSEPQPLMVGDIQAVSAVALQQATAQSFIFSDDLWHFSAQQSSAKYVFEEPGMKRLDSAKQLPAEINGQVWSMASGGSSLVCNNTNPGTVTYFMKSKSPYKVEVDVKTVCSEITGEGPSGGCHSCLSGAYFNMTARSICEPGFAAVVLKDDAFNGINSPNLMTTSVLLSTTDSSFKIYFRTNDSSVTAQVCLVSPGKTSCQTFKGDFSSDIIIDGNNQTTSDNSTGQSSASSGGSLRNWWGSVENWFSSIGEWFRDHLEMMIAILVSVAALITLVLLLCCCHRSGGTVKIMTYVKKKRNEMKKKKELEEASSLSKGQAREDEAMPFNMDDMALRRRGGRSSN